MFCTNCGNKIKENSSFCTSCGNEVTDFFSEENNIINSIKNKKLNSNQKEESQTTKIVSYIIVGIVIIGMIFSIVLASLNKTQQKGVKEQEIGTQNIINGVGVSILKEGTGDISKSGDTVAMNYTGSLEDGTIFDSNIDPKFNHVQPFIFTIGAGQVIKGWDVGIIGMKVGEKRKLVINPDFAYGTAGAGDGVIPSNATLIFEVELMGIKK